MQLSVSADFSGVKQALDRLHGAIRDQALASAINKTLDQAKTEMTRQITREYNVKADYVRQRLRIRRAISRGQVRLEGSLVGSRRGRSANIIAFVERSTSLAQAKKRAKGGTRKQLYVKIKRTGPAKPLANAFIGNRGRTVFERVGKERLPIRAVQTIDVGQMFNTRRINTVVVAKMRAKFPEIFAREAAYFTGRFNRGEFSR